MFVIYMYKQQSNHNMVRCCSIEVADILEIRIFYAQLMWYFSAVGANKFFFSLLHISLWWMSQFRYCVIIPLKWTGKIIKLSDLWIKAVMENYHDGRLFMYTTDVLRYFRHDVNNYICVHNKWQLFSQKSWNWAVNILILFLIWWGDCFLSIIIPFII